MKPDYSWAALNSRLAGLESTSRKTTHPLLRTDYITNVYRDFKDRNLIVATLGTQKIAFISPEKVSVQYVYTSDTMHRRLNEILMAVGWAVAEREGAWLLVRRKDDGGVVYPFLSRTLATVAPEWDSPIFETEV